MPRVNYALLLLVLLSWLHQNHQNPTVQSPVNGEKQRTATVTGQVILDGEPLSGVTIRLFPYRMAVDGDPRKPLQAITDGQGRYRITGIIAGSYQIGIQPDEFLITGGLPSDLQRRMISVVGGEKVEQFDLILRRGGVITGQVTDSSGHPLVRQQIELTRIGEDGKPQPRPFNHPMVKMTDKQGVYRITNLPAGRYLVSAGMTSSARFGTPIPGDAYYPQTFYPGVSDPSQAREVEVSEGAETTGIDIIIVAAIKTYGIKGRVVRAETGEPAEGIEIFYSPYREGDGVTGGRSNVVRSNSEGEFQFQGVLPGKYVLYPQIGAEREYFSEAVICEISDSGIDGIEVKLLQGSSISGIVTIDGANDPAIRAKLSHLRIGGFSKTKQPIRMPREPAEIKADGSFRITGLQPGKIYFVLSRDPRAGGFAIKRAEHNGALVQDGLEIGPGEHLSNVRVSVGYGTLTLRGEFKVIGGSLPPHIGIYMNLDRLNESESGSTMGAYVDARGQFIFENLTPGDYEIRPVCTNFQPGEPLDKALTKLIYNTRQKVAIGSNSQPTITLVIDLSRKEGNQ